MHVRLAFLFVGFLVAWTQAAHLRAIDDATDAWSVAETFSEVLEDAEKPYYGLWLIGSEEEILLAAFANGYVDTLYVFDGPADFLAVARYLQVILEEKGWDPSAEVYPDYEFSYNGQSYSKFAEMYYSRCLASSRSS
jgi:dihydrofolate reductase